MDSVEMSKDAIEAFSKLFTKGLKHYKNVPHAIGYLPETKEGVVGFIVWTDPDSDYITEDGEARQEFYIKADGTICVYREQELRAVSLRLKNWQNFVNPVTTEEVDDEN